MNYRFNLAQVYQKDFRKKAEMLKGEGKKIPSSYYNPKETAIYISCSTNGYVKVHTGIKIKPVDFDVATQTVKTRDQRSIQLQLLLNKIKDDCAIQHMEAKRHGKVLSKFDTKAIMESAVGAKDGTSDRDFIETFDLFIEWKGKHVSERTLSRYRVFRRYLLEFQSARRRQLNMDELDQRFGEEFTEFLISRYSLVQNTYIKYLKLLKAFGRYCVDYEYSDNIKYKQIKAIGHQTSVFVLSGEEIESFAKLKIKNDSLREVRDCFLLLAYTGQRYSDLVDFSWDDIVMENGYMSWKLFQKKTKSVVPIFIPLLPEAIELIENRRGRSGDKVFKVLSNQKMNAKLKDIAKLAKIKGQFTVIRRQGHKTIKTVKDRADCVTSHIGRKSFITNAIIRGMSPDVIRRISGHSDYSAMIPYINIADRFVADQLLSTHSKKQN